MLEGFTWLRENYKGYCMMFVEGLDKRELLQRFGGERSQERFVSFDDQNAIEQFRLFGTVLWVGQCGEWAFVNERFCYSAFPA